MDVLAVLAGVIEFASQVAPYVAEGVGRLVAEGDYAAALQLAQDQLTDAQKMQVPELERAVAEVQGNSEFGKLQEDRRRIALQDQALEALSREVQFQGMTPEDAAAYQQMRSEAGSIEAGLRGANDARMRQRGMASSIGSYAGGLAGAQAGANSANEMGLGIAADSRKRYLQAVDQLGDLSTRVRGQEWGQMAQGASAQDAINRFNTGNRWDAQKYNLGLAQQNFENQMRRQAAIDAARGGYGDALRGRGQQTQRDAAFWGQVGKEGGHFAASQLAGIAGAGGDDEESGYRNNKTGKGGK